MASENQVQQFVHKLEEGGWVKWVQLTLLIAVCVAGMVAFIFDPTFTGLFKGLSHPKGMDQAQIAREIARGNGFSTRMIRPAVLAQFKENKGSIPVEVMPDTYHAPLWPVVLAPALRAFKSTWSMTTKDLVYTPDRVVAGVAAIFFMLAAMVNYFSVRRLFDRQLALIVTGLVLVCDLFWRFAQTGLPQTLMLFFFSVLLYTFIRAVENEDAEKSPLPWLAGSAALFGLLALTHGITIWMFPGALLFCGIYFQERKKVLLTMVGVFVLIYSPWLVRNYMVCGNPLGSSQFSAFFQVKGSEGAIMRDTEFKTDGISPLIFRNKIQAGIAGQFADLFRRLGGCLVAPVFFLALMHLFKNRTTSILRWLLLSMWLFAVFGMAVFGSDDETSPLSSNDLHTLFIPMFAAYGLAFVLVLWTRLEINVSLVQKAFIGMIFAVSALPILNTITGNVARTVVQWPPYVPPYIAILNGWTTDQEIIASDMPWAVAWYADRKSLWLPITLQDFVDLNDYGRLGGRIVGLYLTPVTGNRALVSDVVKGEFKEWAPFILRAVNAKDFPLRAATALPMDNQCIFYADHDRWSDRLD